jgi:tRNA pseudouridine55 synthase
MQGLLLVDKPAGWTSFDVVNYIRRIISNAESVKPKAVKVGHAGTLDPFATGLLVILVGKVWTRRASDFSGLDKIYQATMTLGLKSTTGDPEGELSTSMPAVKPDLADIESALKQNMGKIMQTPPAFSAIKVGGIRAYKAARAGEPLKLEPRQVEIKRLELVNYNYPQLELLSEVSFGTYIRSLVEDIAKTLKNEGYTSKLRRVSIGKFKLDDAVNIKDLTVDNIDKLLLEL